ncbi:hypothetical protein ACOMHN_028692 [Nucella lapillus]
MPPSYGSGEIAGYAYVIPQEDSANLTLEDHTDANSHLVMINGTLIRILFKKPFRDSDLNELLYVIIVIVFYATALMTLIITQIKRQRREGMDVDYYDEYLQRNQEVKATCKTATTLVLKAPSSSTLATNATGSTSISASASADRSAAAVASAVSLLEPPSRGRDLSPRVSPRHGGFGSGRGGFGGGGEEFTPTPSPRELSPMLESIPDIGT